LQFGWHLFGTFSGRCNSAGTFSGLIAAEELRAATAGKTELADE